jgi:hypothetical protein
MTIRDDQVASQGRGAWRNNAGRKGDNAVKGLAALIVVALLAFMIFSSAGTENDGRTSVSQTTNAGPDANRVPNPNTAPTRTP